LVAIEAEKEIKKAAWDLQHNP